MKCWVDAKYIANSTDRRIAPTPSSGLGVGGANGRTNTFMIDGLDNLYNSGSVRSSISQEAVREFQVNRSTFSAEQGGAPGGTINIVTKGGTNEQHGTLFGSCVTDASRRATTSIQARVPILARRTARRSAVQS